MNPMLAVDPSKKHDAAPHQQNKAQFSEISASLLPLDLLLTPRL